MPDYAYSQNRHKRATWQLVVNSYPCPTCGAPDGLACRTTSNARAAQPHAERSARAAVRGWAFADKPALCVRCHGALPLGNEDWPKRCARCVLREDGPAPTHATAEHPGPDGSYDVPLPLEGMDE
jgi:hypothetical protein